MKKNKGTTTDDVMRMLGTTEEEFKKEIHDTLTVSEEKFLVMSEPNKAKLNEISGRVSADQLFESAGNVPHEVHN